MEIRVQHGLNERPEPSSPGLHPQSPFLSFTPVRSVYPSLTLKAVILHAYDDQNGALFDSFVDCETALSVQCTETSHARLYDTRLG
ncbi:uncharacterized protein EDB93DRAFT_1256434 [Suillus bovinus]|uniref:uncharacterized protein n=1 Tax=Suillus bovinus TaxID=48563 RepID=UPI001B86AC88|nr:uncharacterized protein EDB93DRAFT_1256434 [Suillus bovinus]KAG2129047.1 hypothetical protein EDB93DRAFT_1256434 [Suillus bovinus]